MRGIVRDCVSEMLARKIFWVFAVITIVAVIIIALSSNVDLEFRTGQNDMTLEDIDDMFGNPIVRVFTSFVSFMVILSVLATAGLIPNMLIPGRAEFYLSKPVSRTSLLLNKVFGIWLSYGVLIVVCGLAAWGVVKLVHGVSMGNVAYVFIFNLISLFIWLSITSFSGIVFGSTTMAIISAAIIWAAQWILGFRDWFKEVIDSKAVEGVIDVLYYIVPKTGELSDLTVRLARGRPIHDWLPLYSSVIFAVVVLFAAIYIFKRKNY